MRPKTPKTPQNGPKNRGTRHFRHPNTNFLDTNARATQNERVEQGAAPYGAQGAAGDRRRSPAKPEVVCEANKVLTMARIYKESPRPHSPQAAGMCLHMHGRQGRCAVERLESPILRLNRRVRADKLADSLKDSPRQRREPIFENKNRSWPGDPERLKTGNNPFDRICFFATLKSQNGQH